MGVCEKASTRIRVRDAFFVTPFYGPCIISMIHHHNKDGQVQKAQKWQRPCNPAPLSQHTNTTWNCIMSFIWVRHGPIVLLLHWLSSSNAQLEHTQKQRRAYISYTQHSSITMWVTLHADAQTENSQATVPDLGHPCNSCMPGWRTHPHFHLKSPWLRNRHHPGDSKPLNWPPAHNHIQRGHMHSYPFIHACSFAVLNACTSSSFAFSRLTNSPGITEGMWSWHHADVLHSHVF